MSNIKWGGGKVCYAYGEQYEDPIISSVLRAKDFQINEIRIGDYIEASELDTEQKYNDAVEVFELFGFDPYLNCEMDKSEFIKQALNYGEGLIVDDELDLVIYNGVNDISQKIRKLTYPQLMAIGKLKRAMIERDKREVRSDFVNALDEAVTYAEKIALTKTSKDYLNECIEVQNQRGEQYGPKGTGERSFAAAASAFNAMTGKNLKGSDACLLLTCVKAVRQYSDPTRVHEDSLLDLVSYASLWAEELNKELK